VPNVVNLARTTPATCALVVRHLDRPGVLAGVLDAIRLAEINVQEMENIIFEGTQAAVARIHRESSPGPEAIARIQASSPHILEVSLIAL
jgi:D-3-phosphoglycerate dehydrogenase